MFAAGALLSHGVNRATPEAPAAEPTTITASAAEPVATFSIVGFDPETGDLGIAVQSKFFAVGAVVPWARARVGAVATQSHANTAYGPDGLALLSDGETAADVVARLTENDDGRSLRQLGIVDATGRAASFTGDACLPWAGGKTGEYYAAQGNILAGPEVVDAMASTFESTSGDLGTRLVAALAAGQAAGGDARGRQSAALLVVREGGGYGGFNDRYIDVRVDDHPTPIRELQRLLGLRRAQMTSADAGRYLRAGEHDLALESARRTTTLSPNDGNAWLLLARVHVARGETPEAGQAGREALIQDPWLKTAALRGLIDKALIERLLGIDSFAQLWESIEADS